MISDIFKDYDDLKINNKKIRAFSDENNEWLQELRNIFLHKTHSELYIVIEKNIVELSNDLNKIVALWEERVLEYLNFEYDDLKTKKYLKYNVTLIVLCIGEKNIEGTDRRAFIKEEKSTNICRKIFLFCEDSGTIPTAELKYLPFYLESIKVDEKREEELMEKRDLLNGLIKEAKEFLRELLNEQGEKDYD
jgi:hypothetical protein